MDKLFRFANAFIDGVVNGIVGTDSTKRLQKKQSYYPQNHIEVSIQTISNIAVNSDSLYIKDGSAKKIFEIVRANWSNIPDTTKSYAIQQLGRIRDSSPSIYLINNINDLITKIAIGNLKGTG